MNAAADIRMEIRLGDLNHPQVLALLRQHLQAMQGHSPPASVHALDVVGLQLPEITFWTAWRDDDLLGCGALKELDRRQGEIKSMRTAEAHLRKGVARAMLEHIVAEATRRGYQRLSLETGSAAAFAAAIHFYQSAGFEICGPFGDYVLDPHSVFMTKQLA